MRRFGKWALAFLATVIVILLAGNRKVVLEIGFPCDSYWGVPGEDYYTFMDDAIARFEAAHPNVRVKYTSGILGEDYSEWLSGRYLLGREPDVMVILPEDFIRLSDKGALKRLEPYKVTDAHVNWEDFYPAALQSGADNGIQYALPLECVPQMMFINKTLLQKEGIPIPDSDWTWDDFYNICEKVTKDTDGDGIVDQFGVYDYGWDEAMTANGCSLVSEDGRQCLLDQTAQEEAVSFAQKLFRLNQGSKIDEKTFDEGCVAFRPLLFSEYRGYEPYPWRIKRSSNFEWDCIPMPAGISADAGNYSTLSTLLLGISSRTRHEKLAWELLKTISCTQEMQTEVYTTLRGVSALRSVTESQQVTEILRQDSPGTVSLGLEVLPRIMENAVAQPQFTKYRVVMETADRLITEVMSADRNLLLQLMQVQQELDHLLTE